MGTGSSSGLMDQNTKVTSRTTSLTERESTQEQTGNITKVFPKSFSLIDAFAYGLHKSTVKLNYLQVLGNKGLMHGQGEYTWPDGKVYTGISSSQFNK